jgi:hypothetical protein
VHGDNHALVEVDLQASGVRELLEQQLQRANVWQLPPQQEQGVVDILQDGACCVHQRMPDTVVLLEQRL